MTERKRAYVSAIRSDSTYPTYRAIVGIIAIIIKIVAVLVAIGALFGGLAAMQLSMVIGLAYIVGGGAYAVLLWFGATYFNEGALILADIADSILDKNSQ